MIDINYYTKLRSSNRTFIVFCFFVVFLGACIQEGKSEKLRLCVVDGKGGFKRSPRYCPTLDHPESRVECVLGIDRLDCLRRLSKGKVDFSVFTAEDLVTAANSEIQVLLTNELRYTESKFEYEVVAIARDSSGIQSKHDLKDKRFCHPGYGSEADWTRILANFLEASVVPKQCSPQFTITENRIRASSQYFSAACKAGPWVNNPKADQELKQKYPNLCKSCDNPSKCSSEDKYWGRRGSLFCLTDGSGDVSWARWDDAQMHFGLVPGGNESAPDGYSFVCPDGTTKPLASGKPCIWVVKPWPVIASKRARAQDVLNLLGDLVGNQTDDFSWEYALLNLIETFQLNLNPLNPVESIETYLSKSTGFLSANSFSGCHPPRTINICTTSNLENAKCLWLRESAAVYGVEPDLDCIKADNTTHCMQALNQDVADLVMVPPDLLNSAVTVHNLTTIFYETVEDVDKYITVAVARNSSTHVNSIEDVKGLRACFPVYDGIAWNSVLHRLHEKNLIQDCPLEQDAADFFGPSCVPGLPANLSQTLRKTCNGDSYNGELGALRCLMLGKGDVAFVSKNSLHKFIKNPTENKYGRITMNDFKILCDDNQKPEDCHLSWSPIGQAMVSSSKPDLWIRDTYDVFLQLDNLFGRNYKSLTTPLQLYALFNEKPDILFHDRTLRLRDVPTARYFDNMKRPYLNIVQSERKCNSSATIINGSVIVLLIVYLCNVI